MQTNLKEVASQVEDVLSEASRIKSMVSEAVEDGVKSAMKAIKQGRNAAEDVISDTRYTVKRNPFQAMGIVFAAGVLTGSFLGWLGTRRN
jgi:ElaB/YqjD/DUF883 family membrane-anchored ribosome-binding protein